MPLPSHLATDFNFKRGDATASFRLYWISGSWDPFTSDAQLIELAEVLKDTFSPLIAPLLTTTTQFVSVRAALKYGDNEYEGYSYSAETDGTVSSTDVLPEECAVVIQRRTGLKGRANRGRIFFPFVPETFALDSTLTGSAATLYAAFATEMQSAQTGELGEFEFAIQPATPNFKNNVVQPIGSTRIVMEIMSRRDRRAPRKPGLRQVGAPLGGG